MTHFCIDVFTLNYETQEWELWFTQSFKTKKLAEIWANGFTQGLEPVYFLKENCTIKPKLGRNKKLSDIYKRERDYEPNVK